MKKLFSASSINARMLTLALCSAMLTLVVGLFGMSQTSRVNDLLNAMYKSNLTPIAHIANANMQAIYHNRAMFAYVAEDEPPKRAKIFADMQKAEASMNELLNAYRKTFLEPKEKELLAQFDAAWPPYVAISARAIKVSQEEGKTADAVVMLTDDVAPVFKKIDDILSALVELNIVLAKQAYDESDEVVNHSRTTSWVVIAFAVLASVGGALLIGRSITRPLGGEPATVVDAADAIADGDLSRHIAVRPGDTSSVVARMAAMQTNLAHVVAGVRENAEGVASASTQIAQGNNDLSGRTEEQASALEQTAASMEELSTTVKLNADHARQANQLAQTASTVARQGGDVVGRVVGTMKEINESSGRIADIIAVIDGIAFQTNILALNAAVEAARAGEQGRGFAVVAGEVRTLAGRSAEAAKEIKALITASVDRVSAGTQLVDEAGTTMQQVVQSIVRVNEIMGDISRASAEQSSGVSQIGQAVMQMDLATQQNAALVEESAAAADKLSQQADELLRSVAVFRLASNASRLLAPPASQRMQAAPAAARKSAAAPTGLVAARSPTAALPPASKPKAKALAATSAGGGDDDWTSF